MDEEGSAMLSNGILENNTDYEIREEPIGNRTLKSTLTIINSQPSDTGQYICTASNDVTFTEESATLTVHGMCQVVQSVVRCAWQWLIRCMQFESYPGWSANCI